MIALSPFSWNFWFSGGFNMYSADLPYGSASLRQFVSAGNVVTSPPAQNQHGQSGPSIDIPPEPSIEDKAFFPLPFGVAELPPTTGLDDSVARKKVPSYSSRDFIFPSAKPINREAICMLSSKSNFINQSYYQADRPTGFSYRGPKPRDYVR